MKIKTTVSKIEKTFSVKFDLDQKIPYIVIGKALVELYRNGDERLAFVLVRRVDDRPDSMTDYHPGSYEKTIKGAIESIKWINERAVA